MSNASFKIRYLYSNRPGMSAGTAHPHRSGRSISINSSVQKDYDAYEGLIAGARVKPQNSQRCRPPSRGLRLVGALADA